MLAGLPKAPSAYNPVTNPQARQDPPALRAAADARPQASSPTRSSQEAQNAPLAVRQGLRDALPTHAEYVAEMARQVVFDAYGEDAYTKGITV